MWRRAAKIVGSTTALCAGLSVVKAATKPAPPLMTYSEPDPSQFELVQVQVIMRHGARSTCALLDTETPESFARDWKQCHDPEQQLEDAELRSCVPGQLTVNGEHMCVELGKRLASRYRDTLGFLPNTYDPSSMHVESTTYQRARLSLKRMLEGLFPNGGAPSQEHLDNQIDPDNILVTRLRGCNALLTDYRSAYREAVMEIEDNPVFSNLRARIKEGGGADPMDTKSWVAVGDWAHSRTFHGIPLRDDLPEDFLPTVERAAWHEFRGMLAATAQSLRLGLGPFVDRIVAQTDYAASRHKPPGAEVRTNVDLYAADREAWERETGSGKSQDVAIAGLGTPGQSTKGPQLKALNEDPFSPHPNFSVLSENPPKLVVYSGHDTSLTPLAAILGVPLRSWPPFSSHFELELWRHKAHDPAQELYAYNKLESIVSHKKPGKELTHKDKFPPGREWPHVRSDAPAPAPVSDQYWVRAIFNGDVVRVMPLGHFKETMSYFGTGGIDRRRVECGEFDPYIGNWIWDNAPANTIEGKMGAEKAKGKK